MKQLIQKEFLIAIAIYQQQDLEVNNWQQIAVSLSEKIRLRSAQNLSQGLVYRCAIAFPLANLVKLSPLSTALQLVSLLPYQVEKTANDLSLEVTVTVVESGWIDIYICDRNIIIWLNLLVARITIQSSQILPNFVATKSKKNDNFFVLQYIYGRCSSLLNLGQRAGLIVLEPENSPDFRWQIKQPFPLKWSNSQGNLVFFQPSEINLLQQISLMLDELVDNQEDSCQHWIQFNTTISAVWLQFVANCRFCGEVQQQNPTLATARLGLIALTQWCLQAILVSRFSLIPLKEI